MFQTRILTTRESDEWTRLLEKTEYPDIYFTPEYAKIYEYDYNNEEINGSFCGQSLLFFFGNKDDFIIYPIIMRNINELPFLKEEKMQNVFDISSHYGYGGPLIKCSDKKIEKHLIKNFLTEFNKFCTKNNIITEFIRFHPLINNHQIFESFLSIDERNKTVHVDLTKDEKTILKDMNKKTRNRIRKAKKSGVEIERSTNEEDLKKFTDLYLQTMRKNKANKKYLFPLKFFKNTVNLLKNNVSLFVAKYNKKIISAALFMHKYKFVHYHFSGSDMNFCHLSPNNLLLWEVMLWGKEHGFEKFHLGGGLHDEDNLYRFKSGFSKNRSTFYTANVIHNEKIYKELCNLKNSFEIKNEKEIIKSDFFPNYRR